MTAHTALNQRGTDFRAEPFQPYRRRNWEKDIISEGSDAYDRLRMWMQAVVNL